MADIQRDQQHAAITTSDNQTYHGIVVTVDETIGKIVLKGVSIGNTKLPGLHNFYVSNIKDLVFTDGGPGLIANLMKSGSQKKRVHSQLQHKKDKPMHLRELLRFDSDQLVRSPCNCAGDDSGDQGIGSAEETEVYEDYCQIGNFTMFHRTCEKFRDTITHLMDQQVIAVTFFGVDISRAGTLSLIQVATEKSIVMFDILRLGPEGFIDGLQAVLESQGVLKVIHDCRMVSDLLYHQYSVNLSNVFDTQVAGAFVSRLSNGGDWPRFVDSLPCTLKKFLHLGNDQVYQFFLRERVKQRDEEVWIQRPLCKDLLMDSVKNLSHMISLYRTLSAKMLTEFQIGVGLYLDHARNAPEDRVEKFRSSTHLLPFVFQDLTQLAGHSVRQNRPPSNCPRAYDSHGFLEVCPIKEDPVVTTSRDSIWHQKKNASLSTASCSNSKNKSLNRPSLSVQGSVATKSALPVIPSPCTNAHSGNIDNKVNSSCETPIDIPKEQDDNEASKKQMDELALRLRVTQNGMKSTSSSHHHQSLPVQDTVEDFDRPSPSPKRSPRFSGHSAIKSSALMTMIPADYLSPASSCSEELSDPEIVELRQRTARVQLFEDFDADKMLEFEMSQSILQKARQTYSQTKTAARLLPPKAKRLSRSENMS